MPDHSLGGAQVLPHHTRVSEGEPNLLELVIADARIKNPIIRVSRQPLGQGQTGPLTQAIRELLAAELGIVDKIVSIIKSMLKCEANTSDNVIAVDPARDIQAVALHKATSR
jgi:hypothetical protein